MKKNSGSKPRHDPLITPSALMTLSLRAVPPSQWQGCPGRRRGLSIGLHVEQRLNILIQQGNNESYTPFNPR
ncbi:hypothetical protein YpsIP31758_0307 [Yersinia pseudotuberculosis IP 31758]|uniref:Uncharacterized protein n=1 Tax=Yersinia pseudotuberculosis serotype O:1b (strain IP 31758) TaxID=349747 RepID=A0A0U1R0I2_YERP3|nr:hypothetical protein YpsIP31758_0307 [Yersinia pseudotuberculosis IP 31758]